MLKNLESAFKCLEYICSPSIVIRFTLPPRKRAVPFVVVKEFCEALLTFSVFFADPRRLLLWWSENYRKCNYLIVPRLAVHVCWTPPLQICFQWVVGPDCLPSLPSVTGWNPEPATYRSSRWLTVLPSCSNNPIKIILFPNHWIFWSNWILWWF